MPSIITKADSRKKFDVVDVDKYEAEKKECGDIIHENHEEEWAKRRFLGNTRQHPKYPRFEVTDPDSP